MKKKLIYSKISVLPDIFFVYNIEFAITYFNMKDYHHVQLKKNLPSHSGTREDQSELPTSIKTAVYDDQVRHVN